MKTNYFFTKFGFTPFRGTTREKTFENIVASVIAFPTQCRYPVINRICFFVDVFRCLKMPKIC